MRKRYRKYRWTQGQKTDKREAKDYNYFLSQTFPFGIIEGVKG